MGGILVVDDDESTVAVLAKLLTDAGYTVRAAANGVAALIAVGTERPALILLDVRMPIVDGAMVARKLRSLDATLPIVVMSVALEQAAALVAAGQADAFVAKPFQVDALLRCVTNFVPLAQDH
jgi:two-component system, OmpR family, response regulator MprA